MNHDGFCLCDECMKSVPGFTPPTQPEVREQADTRLQDACQSLIRGEVEIDRVALHKRVEELIAEGKQATDQGERCQNCNVLNPVWFAPSELWNKAIPEISGILCPVCFILRAESVGINPTGWILQPEQLQPATEQDRDEMIADLAEVVESRYSSEQQPSWAQVREVADELEHSCETCDGTGVMHPTCWHCNPDYLTASCSYCHGTGSGDEECAQCEGKNADPRNLRWAAKLRAAEPEKPASDALRAAANDLFSNHEVGAKQTVAVCAERFMRLGNALVDDISKKPEPGISEEELAAMEARCEAATKGPWENDLDDIGIDEGDDYTVSCQGGPIINVLGYGNFPCFNAEEDDGEKAHQECCSLTDFITNARTDMPRLIAEIRKGRNADSR